MSAPLTYPGPDVSKAPLLIGVSAVLHAISLPIFVARIWTRVRPTMRLGLDDYFITAAVIFDLAEWVPLLIGIYYGVGRHNYYVDPEDMILAEKWLFLSQPPYAWSLTCSKLSIIWMLIRIQRDKRVWKMFLWFMMVFAVGTAVTMNSFQFTLCKPLSAVWDHNPAAICTDPKISQGSVYATAAMTIFTDVILSLMPLLFITNIQRPLRERIVLAFIMGLGIFASSASIAKTAVIKDYGITGDDLTDSVAITIWSILEMQLAIIASCIPTLRQPFEKLLRQIGVLSKSKTNVNYYAKPEDSATNRHFQLSDLRSSNQRIKLGPDNDAISVESQLPIMPTKDNRNFTKVTITSAGGEHSDSSQEFVGAYVGTEPGIRKHTTVSIQHTGPHAV